MIPTKFIVAGVVGLASVTGNVLQGLKIRKLSPKKVKVAGKKKFWQKSKKTSEEPVVAEEAGGVEEVVAPIKTDKKGHGFLGFKKLFPHPVTA